MKPFIIGGILDLMKWVNFMSILCLCCSESFGRVCGLPFSRGEACLLCQVDFPQEHRRLFHLTTEFLSPSDGRLPLPWTEGPLKAGAEPLPSAGERPPHPPKKGLGPLCVLPLLRPGTRSSRHNGNYLTQTHSHWLWTLCGRV